MKKPAKTNRLILTLPEYNRIYQTIYSVLDGRANTRYACAFFAAAGAMILNKYYKVSARAVAGAFLVCVDSSPFVLTYGRVSDGLLVSGDDAFHFWVQTESHLIDFMSPIYMESAGGHPQGRAVERKMFQKAISQEASDPSSVVCPGDYFSLPNLDLTDELVDGLLSRPTSTDLLLAVDHWFEKYPRRMDDLSLKDDLGRVSKLRLQAPLVSGAW